MLSIIFRPLCPNRNQKAVNCQSAKQVKHSRDQGRCYRANTSIFFTGDQLRALEVFRPIQFVITHVPAFNPLSFSRVNTDQA